MCNNEFKHFDKYIGMGGYNMDNKKNEEKSHIVIKIFLMCLLFIAFLSTMLITKAESEQTNSQKFSRVSELDFASYEAIMPSNKYETRSMPEVDLVEEKRSILIETILSEGSGIVLSRTDGSTAKIEVNSEKFNIHFDNNTDVTGNFILYETTTTYNGDGTMGSIKDRTRLATVRGNVNTDGTDLYLGPEYATVFNTNFGRDDWTTGVSGRKLLTYDRGTNTYYPFSVGIQDFSVPSIDVNVTKTSNGGFNVSATSNPGYVEYTHQVEGEITQEAVNEVKNVTNVYYVINAADILSDDNLKDEGEHVIYDYVGYLAGNEINRGNKVGVAYTTKVNEGAFMRDVTNNMEIFNDGLRLTPHDWDVIQSSDKHYGWDQLTDPIYQSFRDVGIDESNVIFTYIGINYDTKELVAKPLDISIIQRTTENVENEANVYYVINAADILSDDNLKDEGEHVIYDYVGYLAGNEINRGNKVGVAYTTKVNEGAFMRDVTNNMEIFNDGLRLTPHDWDVIQSSDKHYGWDQLTDPIYQSFRDVGIDESNVIFTYIGVNYDTKELVAKPLNTIENITETQPIKYYVESNKLVTKVKTGIRGYWIVIDEREEKEDDNDIARWIEESGFLNEIGDFSGHIYGKGKEYNRNKMDGCEIEIHFIEGETLNYTFDASYAGKTIYVFSENNSDNPDWERYPIMEYQHRGMTSRYVDIKLGDDTGLPPTTISPPPIAPFYGPHLYDPEAKNEDRTLNKLTWTEPYYLGANLHDWNWEYYVYMCKPGTNFSEEYEGIFIGNTRELTMNVSLSPDDYLEKDKPWSFRVKAIPTNEEYKDDVNYKKEGHLSNIVYQNIELGTDYTDYVIHGIEILDFKYYTTESGDNETIYMKWKAPYYIPTAELNNLRYTIYMSEKSFGENNEENALRKAIIEASQSGTDPTDPNITKVWSGGTPYATFPAPPRLHKAKTYHYIVKAEFDPINNGDSPQLSEDKQCTIYPRRIKMNGITVTATYNAETGETKLTWNPPYKNYVGDSSEWHNYKLFYSVNGSGDVEFTPTDFLTDTELESDEFKYVITNSDPKYEYTTKKFKYDSFGSDKDKLETTYKFTVYAYKNQNIDEFYTDNDSIKIPAKLHTIELRSKYTEGNNYVDLYWTEPYYDDSGDTNVGWEYEVHMKRKLVDEDITVGTTRDRTYQVKNLKITPSTEYEFWIVGKNNTLRTRTVKGVLQKDRGKLIYSNTVSETTKRIPQVNRELIKLSILSYVETIDKNGNETGVVKLGWNNPYETIDGVKRYSENLKYNVLRYEVDEEGHYKNSTPNYIKRNLKQTERNEQNTIVDVIPKQNREKIYVYVIQVVEDEYPNSNEVIQRVGKKRKY